MRHVKPIFLLYALCMLYLCQVSESITCEIMNNGDSEMSLSFADYAPVSENTCGYLELFNFKL